MTAKDKLTNDLMAEAVYTLKRLSAVLELQNLDIDLQDNCDKLADEIYFKRKCWWRHE